LYGNILFHGKSLSAYDEGAKGTLAWFYNPLIGWEVPAGLCVLFIGMGVLFVFHKSRVLALQGNAVNYTRKIKDLEETIRDKNSALFGLGNDRDNMATMIGNVRKELSQYREGYDSVSREIAKVKEQCQAELVSKDQDHERVLDVIKREFSEVILLTKKDCRGQIEQIKKQYENQGRPIMDENTI
jgi:septal ring factor EnvC (AmiA/AmiB activator)